MQAIWKDYYVDLTSHLSGGRVEWRILAGGQPIYNAIAVADPTGECSIRVNDVCADYLCQSLPVNDAGKFITQDITRRFIVQYRTASGWMQAASVDFYLDWSFDYDFAPVNGLLSAPVNGVLDSRAPFFLSVAGNATLVVNVHRNNAWYAYTFTYTRDGSFNPSFNISFEGSNIPVSGSGGTWVIPDSVLAGADRILVGDTLYTIGNGCGRYALYYVNAHGGWDILSVNDNERKTDSYTRFSVKQTYDNRTSEGRGSLNYANEIVRSWTLRTPLLTDAQSQRMQHLIGSTMVYLYDLAEGRFYPVELTDTQCDYKTFRNQGGQRVQYDINCELGHDMSRKWILQRR